MKFPLFGILKILSTACFSFLFLPLLMVVGAGLGARGDGTFWAGPLLLLTAAGCVGMGYKLLLHPKVERCCGAGLALANLLSILLAAGCGFGGFFGAGLLAIPEETYSWTGFAFPLAAGICCGIAYLGGSVLSEHGYGDILTPVYFGVLTGADAVCVFVAWIMKWQISAGILAVCYLIAAGVAALARNQANIDFLMARRKHSLSHLPLKMRWYSLGLVGGCFAVIVVGFLFRGQIAGALSWLLELLKKALGAFLRWAFRDGGQEEEPEIVEEAAPSGQDMGLPESSESSFFWTIFGWLMLLGILALIFYYRREILEGLRNIGRKVTGLLRSLILRKGRTVPAGSLEGYYEDDVEDLPREPEPASAKKQRPYDLRRWKKDYRLFRGMPDGQEKARQGYRLALMYLLLRKVPLTPADTPAEILAKSEQVLPAASFRSITAAYRAVRYGELSPSEEELSQLSALLENCADGRGLS